ncbi:DUF5785 family protein [Halosegnis longus]|uniref:Uncharacterized protein n=1 Tax=Halosegnis longus TaxID=2216012 RepID=A0AAJ4R8U2_9EURY|nr:MULTISPECIES: DUF5785 family protein [Halobacteriales]RNJ26352.1 hypothetical protein Nmn1133_06515 [Salella cibi]
MDWPHDPDGEEGSEGMRKFGHAVIVKKIDEDESFPLQKSEFVEEYGDDPVRMDHETVVSLADVFEYVEEDTFDDLLHFHKCIGQGLRDSPHWKYNPFVGEDQTA